MIANLLSSEKPMQGLKEHTGCFINLSILQAVRVTSLPSHIVNTILLDVMRWQNIWYVSRVG